jgi:hypothetical protein
MDCSYCRLRHTCDKYAEALRTPTYITGCCTAFTFDTSRSDDAFAYRVRQPMTNGDRIRAMSDEELADFLGWRSLCGHIQIDHYEVCETRGVCGGCVLNWLKQTVRVEK